MSKTASKMLHRPSVSRGRPAGRVQPGLAARVSCVAAHAKSDITHKPGPIFAEAVHGYVLLQQHGKTNFVLVAEPLLGGELRVGDETARVLALVATSVEHYPNLPGFAWTASLPETYRRQMRDDLVLGLRRAAEGDASAPDARWRAYDQALYEWKATAEALADPELTRRLLDDWPEEDEVTLSRP